MITAIEIIKAIATRLKDTFNLPVYSQNTQEGFTKTCFFIEVADSTSGMIASDIIRDSLPIRITYIALNEKQLKTLIDVRAKLTKLFSKGLEVTDSCYVNLEEDISFTITNDHNLECLLEFAIYQDASEDDSELPNIEELETNL